jgi:hypothetical protein
MTAKLLCLILIYLYDSNADLQKTQFRSHTQGFLRPSKDISLVNKQRNAVHYGPDAAAEAVSKGAPPGPKPHSAPVFQLNRK